MNSYEFLLANWTKEELAKVLLATTKENITLRDKCGALETEIFWMKVKERND